jgi:hypothetical protein
MRDSCLNGKREAEFSWKRRKSLDVSFLNGKREAEFSWKRRKSLDVSFLTDCHGSGASKGKMRL